MLFDVIHLNQFNSASIFVRNKLMINEKNVNQNQSSIQSDHTLY